MFTPEGIFEKWARGEDVQLGDFESEQLRGWVYRKLSDIAVAAERGAVEETHRVLAEALRLLNFAGYMAWRFPDLEDLLARQPALRAGAARGGLTGSPAASGRQAGCAPAPGQRNNPVRGERGLRSIAAPVGRARAGGSFRRVPVPCRQRSEPAGVGVRTHVHEGCRARSRRSRGAGRVAAAGRGRQRRAAAYSVPADRPGRRRPAGSRPPRRHIWRIRLRSPLNAPRSQDSRSPGPSSPSRRRGSG